MKKSWISLYPTAMEARSTILREMRCLSLVSSSEVSPMPIYGDDQIDPEKLRDVIG